MATQTVASVSGNGTYNFTGGTFVLVKSLTMDVNTQPDFSKRFSSVTPKRVGMYGWYALLQVPTGGPPNRVLWWKWIEFESEVTFFPITGNNTANANRLDYFIYPVGVVTFNINS